MTTYLGKIHQWNRSSMFHQDSLNNPLKLCLYTLHHMMNHMLQKTLRVLNVFYGNITIRGDIHTSGKHAPTSKALKTFKGIKCLLGELHNKGAISIQVVKNFEHLV